MSDWQAFVTARDGGALLLWGLAIILGLLVAALPPRWRPWALGGIALYALAMPWTL